MWVRILLSLACLRTGQWKQNPELSLIHAEQFQSLKRPFQCPLFGAREVDQWFPALVALPEALGLSLRLTRWLTVICNSDAHFWPLWVHTWCTDTHKTRIQIKLNQNKFCVVYNFLALVGVSCDFRLRGCEHLINVQPIAPLFFTVPSSFKEMATSL